MNRSSFFVKQAVLTLVFACILGLAVINTVPLFANNLKLLMALPVAGAGLFFMSLNFEWTITAMIATRALLDPLLVQTRSGTGPGIGGLLNFFVILMVLAAALRFPEKVKKCRFLKPWIFFLAVCLPMAYLSPNRSLSIRVWLMLVTYGCMFLAPFLVVRDERDKRSWVRILLLSSLVPIAIACVGYVLKNPTFFRNGRLNGTFSHENILAFYTVWVMTVTFYALKTNVLKLAAPQRFGLVAYIGLLATVLVLTQTRSAWLSCLTIFMLYGFLKDKRLILYLVVGVALLMVTPPVQTRLKDLQEGTGARKTEKLNSMAWRVQLWQSAIPSILKKPVFGHGLGSFQESSRDFFPLAGREGNPSHNVYVETLFETGLLGLLAYCAIFVSMLKVLFKRMRSTLGPASSEAAITLVCILGYLIVNISDNMQYYLAFNWYFWFFCGLILAGIDLETRPKETESPV